MVVSLARRQNVKMAPVDGVTGDRWRDLFNLTIGRGLDQMKTIEDLTSCTQFAILVLLSYIVCCF